MAPRVVNSQLKGPAAAMMMNTTALVAKRTDEPCHDVGECGGLVHEHSENHGRHRGDGAGLDNPGDTANHRTHQNHRDDQRKRG